MKIDANKVQWGKVVKVDGVLRFFRDSGGKYNGIPLREAGKRYAAQIVGSLRVGHTTHWIMRCKTRTCENFCAYHKGMQKQKHVFVHCDACTYGEVGKVFERTIDGVLYKKKVSRASWSSRYQRPAYFTLCASCNSEYPMGHFLGAKKRIHCQACHRQYRTIHGIYVVSEAVWLRRDELLPPRQVKCKGKTILRWTTKCSKPDCNETVIFRTDQKTVYCRNCKYDLIRLRPYEALYNVHLKQDACRRTKTSHYGKSELTYEQFYEAMQDTACHYCHKEVHRSKYLVGVKTAAMTNSPRVYLDRIDPLLPYKHGNICTCCHGCNVTKNKYLTEHEMLFIMASRAGDTEQMRRSLLVLQSAYKYPDPIDITLAKRGARCWTKRK